MLKIDEKGSISMPMSVSYKDRLFPILKDIASHFGTPFHLYDETGIQETGENLIKAFSNIDIFREYYAVKALPNPSILRILKNLGFGFDCSSIPELLLSRGIGAGGEDIIFTSNNTSTTEFEAASSDGGCILNLDDISLVPKVPQMPELISFRYNPGPKRTGNSIIGDPLESKYGVSSAQLSQAYQMAIQRGARRLGIHTMLASNELSHVYMIHTVQMLLETVEWLSEELGQPFEFINMGGGLGIPYRPSETPLNLNEMAMAISRLFAKFKDRNGYTPRLYMESGRYITGPHGVLVTRAINRKDIYRTYIGVDASMSSLMRPAIYGAYHHIDILGKCATENDKAFDVVGSLCENNDKFAIQRPLPDIDEGDILCIHDTGAHGFSMGFNYNGRLRPKELLLGSDGTVTLIRREERSHDYFATLNFEPDAFIPARQTNKAA
jgi:diaminopimelate decarboxylase